MSVIINIADAVVAELNAAKLSKPVVSKRLYLPSFDLESMKELHVSVVPRELLVESLHRGRSQFEVQIDLAVQKKFTSGDAVEIDPLIDLVEEIGALFRMHRLSSYPGAIWLRTDHRELYSQEHWEQLSQFTSLMTLAFRALS